MTEIKQDTYKLTPSHAHNMRRAFVMGTVTRDNALCALWNYSYFLHMGGKRPFLHDNRSGIVCPMCPEVVAKIELHMDICAMDCAPHWKRQELRSKRHQVLIDKENAKKAVDVPALKIELNEDERETITMELAEADGEMPVLTKKMTGGYTTVLLLTDGKEDIRHAEAFRIEKDGTTHRVKNPVKNRTRQDLLDKGWKENTIVNFETITLCRAAEEIQQVEQKLSIAA